jgi:hypothetical protein
MDEKRKELMEEKIKELLKKVENKKVTIEFEMYAACCAAVPKYKISVIKNDEEISSSAIELEDALDYLLEKLN